MNPKVLQDILGHSDFSTTANFYLHVTKQNKTNSIDRLSEYMAKINMDKKVVQESI
jgi:site-specific recombinase XerD